MNNDVLNIKDEIVAQQLFLFIFHWKHLDTSIHLFIGPTPSSFSPSLSLSVILCTFYSLSLGNVSSLFSFTVVVDTVELINRFFYKYQIDILKKKNLHFWVIS